VGAVVRWPRSAAGQAEATASEVADPEPVDDEDDAFDASRADGGAFSELFASLDAALVRSDKTLALEKRPATPAFGERNPLVYDLDRDEDTRLAEWRAVVDETRDLPPTLAAALAHQAWIAIEPLQRAPWLGRLLSAAVLSDRGKTRAHLPCLAEGAKAVSRERRRSRDPTTRLVAEVESIAAAAEAGLKQHDRWLTARTLLLRKLEGRRSTSRLPELIDYVQTRPIVSAGMIAKALKITRARRKTSSQIWGYARRRGEAGIGAGASCERMGTLAFPLARTRAARKAASATPGRARARRGDPGCALFCDRKRDFLFFLRHVRARGDDGILITNHSSTSRGRR
jgi:hypothetical protein